MVYLPVSGNWRQPLPEGLRRCEASPGECIGRAARAQFPIPVFIAMLGMGGKERQNLKLGEGRVPGVPGERSWRESL